MSYWNPFLNNKSLKLLFNITPFYSQMHRSVVLMLILRCLNNREAHLMYTSYLWNFHKIKNELLLHKFPSVTIVSFQKRKITTFRMYLSISSLTHKGFDHICSMKFRIHHVLCCAFQFPQTKIWESLLGRIPSEVCHRSWPI